jgi:predicted RND superfamily exporter protein
VEADDAESMRARLAEARRRVEAEPLIESAALPADWWPDGKRQAMNGMVLTNLLRDTGALMKSASDAGFSDEGLALSKAVLSALEAMVGEDGLVFPKSEVAREMMRMFVNYKEDGSGSIAGTISLTENAKPADKDYEALRPLSGDGIWLTGWTLLRPAVAPLVTRDLTHVFLPMAALMVVMLGVMFRSVRETLLVVAALVLSGLLLLAIMSWTGMRWNFLNIAATPLLLGTGIDYGIHVMMTLRRNGGDVAAMWHGTGKAVVFCGCSTAIGFGSLCFASNDALASLGTVAVTGILISMLVSVFLLPAWTVKTGKPG